MNDVQQYYDSDPIREWGREERHRTEFAVTRRFLSAYLPLTPAQILEDGGGPGRYAIQLAKQGYSVTLLDLSQANLDLARQKAEQVQVASEDFVQGDALGLGQFPDENFDALLLLGSLYHLQRVEDRSRAVCEARRILKPNGILFAAFICNLLLFGVVLHASPKI